MFKDLHILVADFFSAYNSTSQTSGSIAHLPTVFLSAKFYRKKWRCHGLLMGWNLNLIGLD